MLTRILERCKIRREEEKERDTKELNNPKTRTRKDENILQNNPLGQKGEEPILDEFSTAILKQLCYNEAWWQNRQKGRKTPERNSSESQEECNSPNSSENEEIEAQQELRGTLKQ